MKIAIEMVYAQIWTEYSNEVPLKGMSAVYKALNLEFVTKNFTTSLQQENFELLRAQPA